MTNLTRYHKNPIDRLISSLLRPFDDHLGFDTWWDISIPQAPEIQKKETDEAIEVSVVLPGVQKDEIKVSAINGALSISSESKSELSYSSFSKSWTLPDSADASKITAKHENGVLHLSIPKTTKEKEEHLIKIE